MAVSVETLTGDTVTFSDEEIGELRRSFRGPLIGPRDEAYDDVRVVHNGMFDRHPGLIFQCSGPADVIDAVTLAREHDLLTSIRGGGHHVAGHSVHDDALMIDLSQMNAVWVDPRERVVRVQGGATWADVDRETQAHGLVVPGGVVSTTGVAGLTLGGGIGWLHRKWGLTCDNLRAAELVTADGELIRASEEENPDLFWGLKGGGGNFGVVTAFEFDAHPLGPMVACAPVFYDPDDAEEILSAWRDWSANVPDEVTSRFILWWLPEHPALPPEVHDREVLVLAATYAGPPDEGEQVLQPIREFGEPLVDLSGRMPFRMFNSMMDPLFPKGEVASYWKSIYLQDLTDEALEVIIERARSRSSPRTLIHVPMMGGAAGRVGATDTAFGDRSAPYMISVDGNWLDREQSDRHIAWVRDTIEEARTLPGGGGIYLNFSGDHAPDDAEMDAAYGENLERLAEVKKTYDPDNFFRLNNNIEPAD
ncbi:MAG: FAD-binding oxidoreductase [Actinomycetota bacterium]